MIMWALLEQFLLIDIGKYNCTYIILNIFIATVPCIQGFVLQTVDLDECVVKRLSVAGRPSMDNLEWWYKLYLHSSIALHKCWASTLWLNIILLSISKYHPNCLQSSSDNILVWLWEQPCWCQIYLCSLHLSDCETLVEPNTNHYQLIIVWRLYKQPFISCLSSMRDQTNICFFPVSI